MARFVFFVGGILAAAPASADWVIFADGQRARVQAVVIAERAVHITTQAGKRWSVLRDSVDVAATLAANEAQAPLEVVTIPEAPPVAAPPETPPARPPPPPPPRPQLAIVERELTPLPSADTEIVQPREPSPRHYRLAITINGIQGTDTLSFADTNQFELFKEPAQIESVYSDPRSGGYELGAQFRIVGPFAVGATVQRFENDREAAYTASLPHPFFFDRFRELSGAVSGLTHEETAVHLDAVITKTWGPLTLDAFGGPLLVSNEDRGPGRCSVRRGVPVRRGLVPRRRGPGARKAADRLQRGRERHVPHREHLRSGLRSSLQRSALEALRRGGPRDRARRGRTERRRGITILFPRVGPRLRMTRLLLVFLTLASPVFADGPFRFTNVM